MKNRLSAWVMALIGCAMALLFCQNATSSDELLAANFIASGQSAIELTSPTQDQQVNTTTPVFTWASKGVQLYVIQVAATSDFSNILINKEITGTTYTLATADVVGGVTLNTATYYWRVKVAKVSNNLQSKTQNFFLIALPSGSTGFAGKLYVNRASTASVQTGSKEAPYKKIQSAISAADALRNNESAITLDILVAQETYQEEINLAPGISIRGGYESTNWTRNIATNTTTILAETDTAIRAGALITAGMTATTIVEGFTIKTSGVITSYAIYCNGSNPTISQNIIFGGDGNFSHGIFNNNSSPQVNSNTILGGVAATTGTAYYGIYNQNGSAPTIRNNLILGGNATNSPAIYNNHANSDAMIENNTLGGQMGSANTGTLRFIGGAKPKVRNNIIFANAGSGVCVEEFDAGSDPTEFQNNNLFGCTNLYRSEGATNLAFMCTNGMPGSSGGCVTGTDVTIAAGHTEGNVSINNGGPLFANINGPDANIFTIADNDWRLNTAAANCNVRGGGSDLSTFFTTDRALITRTLAVPLSGACTQRILMPRVGAWAHTKMTNELQWW